MIYSSNGKRQKRESKMYPKNYVKFLMIGLTMSFIAMCYQSGVVRDFVTDVKCEILWNLP